MQRTRFEPNKLKSSRNFFFFLPDRPSFVFLSPNFHIKMVALVQRPAPTFKAEAVAESLFIDVSLTDYLGKWYVDNLLLVTSPVQQFKFPRHLGLFFSSTQC